MKSVCVFCGSSSGEGVKHLVAAQKLGELIVKENLKLVYGGGNVGIMGEIANSVLKYNGEVTGVIPEDLVSRESALREVTELIIVNSMHERKAKMSDLSDGFIAMSGGIGTLEELFEVWTWAQLGIHSKPIGILNIDNYYTKLIEFIQYSVEQKFVNKENLDMIIIETDAERLLDKMKNFKPVKVKKWIGKEAS
ncbi:MAG TPA: TIGR00730 family Rossman fold protein [Ignavibacteria bacterium]|nr:TIGR00730 family Rossman fold protein [Ignavibacteria bacterium]